MDESQKPTLHIWPGQWSLPSIDPFSLAALLHLQQTIPGQFQVVECSNPDLSPSGQLPFLSHEGHTVASVGSIATYVAKLKSVPHAYHVQPSLVERSQEVAWCSHVASKLGDLVHYQMYSHYENWVDLTFPALASFFPVPQKYYVPARIRASHKSRLEAAGLWNLPKIQKEAKKTFKVQRKDDQPESDKHKHVYVQAFEREKVLEKARNALDIYARLLAGNSFFYQDKPTVLDSMLAAHILLLITPPYPDTTLQSLVMDSYPTLVAHAHRILSTLNTSVPVKSNGGSAFAWYSLIPGIGHFQRRNEEKSEEDVKYDRMRWRFYGLALGTLVVYGVAMLSMLEIRFISRREDLPNEELEEDIDEVEQGTL